MMMLVSKRTPGIEASQITSGRKAINAQAEIMVKSVLKKVARARRVRLRMASRNSETLP